MPRSKKKHGPMSFEAVKTPAGIEVKTKIGKRWYTIADCYAVPNLGDASMTGELIARLLNNHIIRNSYE